MKAIRKQKNSSSQKVCIQLDWLSGCLSPVAVVSRIEYPISFVRNSNVQCSIGQGTQRLTVNQRDKWFESQNDKSHLTITTLKGKKFDGGKTSSTTMFVHRTEKVDNTVRQTMFRVQVKQI